MTFDGFVCHFEVPFGHIALRVVRYLYVLSFKYLAWTFLMINSKALRTNTIYEGCFFFMFFIKLYWYHFMHTVHLRVYMYHKLRSQGFVTDLFFCTSFWKFLCLPMDTHFKFPEAKNKDISGFHFTSSFSQLDHLVFRYLYINNIQMLGFRTVPMKLNSEKRFTRI